MLKVENVSYEIKKRAIVKDVTLIIRPGEFVALLGANGAGKSTLLRLISGELQPARGIIELYDKPLHQYTPDQAAPLKAILNQHNPLTMAFTCREIVMMGRYPYHKSRPAKKDELIVNETMDICGVSALEDRSYMQLSGGEQQRVQLARVLAQLWDQEQGLILLDEPVAGLDMLYQQQTMAIAKALANKGYMVLAALHEINLAAQYADRIFMMKNGRRWNDGTPCEVLTAINIYAIYEVEVDIVVNPRTLTPYVIAREMKLSADLFKNSFQKMLTQ
mgnify:CR=1 FL=1